MVECPLRMRKVPGSNPGSSTIFLSFWVNMHSRIITALTDHVKYASRSEIVCPIFLHHFYLSSSQKDDSYVRASMPQVLFNGRKML